MIFSVPEDNIQEIMKEMNGSDSVPVQVWNRDFSTRLAEGFLLTFDNEIDQSTGTVKLRAQFANEDNELFPNQFVNARLLLSTLHDAILVPTAGVQRTQQGSYVYLVMADKTVERQTVVVGPTQGDTTAIKSGVKAGDIVVTDGLDKLQPGNQVVVRMDKGSPTSRWRTVPPRPPANESVAHIHPETDRHLVADGGNPARGAFGYKELSVSALPEVDYPTIQVLTFYPGRAPT